MANVYRDIYPAISQPIHGPHAPSATQEYALGTKLETRDGRLWRYAKAGAQQLNPALMAQSAATPAQINNETQTGQSSDIGDFEINVLVTTASGIANGDLAEGTMIVKDETGANYAYRIKTNVWVSGDTVMKLTLHEPIVIATGADSVITLVKNAYADVIVAPTTLTGLCIGVPNCVVTATHYFWAQRRGPCALIVDDGDTIVIGEPVGKPGTDAAVGTCGLVANDGTDPVWGICMNVGAENTAALIHLTLE